MLSTNTSKNTPQFANIESTNDKKQTREKMTHLEILIYFFYRRGVNLQQGL